MTPDSYTPVRDMTPEKVVATAYAAGVTVQFVRWTDHPLSASPIANLTDELRRLLREHQWGIVVHQIGPRLVNGMDRLWKAERRRAFVASAPTYQSDLTFFEKLKGYYERAHQASIDPEYRTKLEAELREQVAA